MFGRSVLPFSRSPGSVNRASQTVAYRRRQLFNFTAPRNADNSYSPYPVGFAAFTVHVSVVRRQSYFLAE